MFQEVMQDSKTISIQGYNEKHEVIYWNRASEKYMVIVRKKH